MTHGEAVERAAATLEAQRQGGARLVLAFGDFELLAPAAIEHLRRARELADLLAVAVRDDASIAVERGDGRPLVPFEERCELVGALRWVDLVVPYEGSLPVAAVRALRPDIVALTAARPDDDALASEVEAHGGRCVTLTLPGRYAEYSTESLLRAARDVP